MIEEGGGEGARESSGFSFFLLVGVRLVVGTVMFFFCCFVGLSVGCAVYSLHKRYFLFLASYFYFLIIWLLRFLFFCVRAHALIIRSTRFFYDVALLFFAPFFSGWLRAEVPEAVLSAPPADSLGCW